ncbi:MAG: hypothetical protein JXB15_01340 [Anaerolineales bacterium]|nr:hypothetical protein [Anaerolineales bacterium]
MFSKFTRWLRSKAGMATIAGVLIVAVVLAVAGQQLGWWAGPGTAGIPAASYPVPAGGYTCLPSLVCDQEDGKFLIISSTGKATFAGAKIVAWIAVPGDYTTFELGIFDGDTGKDSAGQLNYYNGNWDEKYPESTYTLYADPLKDGQGNVVIGTWRGNTDAMPNNAWFTLNLNNAPEAKGPSGHYFYRLEVTQDPNISGSNAFKLRSNAYLSTGRSDLTDTSISIVGQLATQKDIPIIYPQFNGNIFEPGSSIYTGEWLFYMYLPNSKEGLEFWDGDFDRGTSISVGPDTDDLNTDASLPTWSMLGTVPEGDGIQGNPADDNFLALYRREPPVKFTLTDPLGSPLYTNEEPSGTEEWERFVMATNLGMSLNSELANPDMVVDSIKPGLYTLHIEGLDMHNLVAFRVNYEICDPEDGCGPCVNPGCDSVACPRTIGYWKNNVKKVLIDQKTNGTQETPESLDWALQNVAKYSVLFRTGINVSAPTPIDNPVRLTDQEANMILQRDKKDYPGDANSMLARALQQNLAAWLNMASGKVSDNTVLTLNVPGGGFEGTMLEALMEAQDIILNGGDLERAKDIGDQINNGLLGEDAEVGSCDAGTDDSKDYEQTMPKDKQPPKHKDMPKAPKPDVPDEVTPGPAPVCTTFNTYKVENPTTNPFYGIKFEYASGTEIKNGASDVFKVTLPADVVQGMTSVQLEGKAATNAGVVTLEADFTSPVGGGEPVKDDSGLFGFTFMGAVDNGDGTYTLSFQFIVYGDNALSHATIGLPDGAVPTESGNFQSESCVAP